MIEILRFYIFVYTPQSQQLPLRIARSVSDTILSHALGLDLKELGKVLLAAPKSRHVDDFNLTLRHDFQEWALMEEKGKLRCKSEQPGLYAGGRNVWPVRSSLHRFFCPLSSYEKVLKLTSLSSPI